VAIATIVPLAVLAAIIFLGRNARRLWPLALIALAWGFVDTYVVIYVNDWWAAAFGIRWQLPMNKKGPLAASLQFRGPLTWLTPL